MNVSEPFANNGCFSGSTVLALSKYATVLNFCSNLLILYDVDCWNSKKVTPIRLSFSVVHGCDHGCSIVYAVSSMSRVLRYELAWLARTLGSWVRIPLKARMSTCVYSVFVLLCV
jgi:hypothetical protein